MQCPGDTQSNEEANRYDAILTKPNQEAHSNTISIQEALIQNAISHVHGTHWSHLWQEFQIHQDEQSQCQILQECQELQIQQGIK